MFLQVEINVGTQITPKIELKIIIFGREVKAVNILSFQRDKKLNLLIKIFYKRRLLMKTNKPKITSVVLNLCSNFNKRIKKAEYAFKSHEFTNKSWIKLILNSTETRYKPGFVLAIKNVILISTTTTSIAQ